jgi:hypothetical protein
LQELGSIPAAVVTDGAQDLQERPEAIVGADDLKFAVRRILTPTIGTCVGHSQILRSAAGGAITSCVTIRSQSLVEIMVIMSTKRYIFVITLSAQRNILDLTKQVDIMSGLYLPNSEGGGMIRG